MLEMMMLCSRRGISQRPKRTRKHRSGRVMIAWAIMIRVMSRRRLTKPSWASWSKMRRCFPCSIHTRLTESTIISRTQMVYGSERIARTPVVQNRISVISEWTALVRPEISVGNYRRCPKTNLARRTRKTVQLIIEWWMDRWMERGRRKLHQGLGKQPPQIQRWPTYLLYSHWIWFGQSAADILLIQHWWALSSLPSAHSFILIQCLVFLWQNFFFISERRNLCRNFKLLTCHNMMFVYLFVSSQSSHLFFTFKRNLIAQETN